MPAFSSFTPYGFLRFSSRPSVAQRYYDAAVKNIGAEANFSEDANVRDKLYADAFVAAIASATVERAGNQADPMCLQEMLPAVERERGIPGHVTELQTDQQRRATLARLRRLTLDGRYTTIRQALVDYLGDDLVGYRVTRIDELPFWAGDPAFYQSVSMENAGQPAVVLTLALGICNPQSGAELVYEVNAVFGRAIELKAGAFILLDPGTARAERVAIRSVDHANRRITLDANAKPHSQGSFATTVPFENMSTPKRIHHIVLPHDMVARRDVVAGIDVIMHRLVCGSAVWQVEDEETVVPGGSGPFVLGSSRLGFVPFARVAV